jgi:hypothetical protein
MKFSFLSAALVDHHRKFVPCRLFSSRDFFYFHAPRAQVLWALINRRLCNGPRSLPPHPISRAGDDQGDGRAHCLAANANSVRRSRCWSRGVQDAHGNCYVARPHSMGAQQDASHRSNLRVLCSLILIQFWVCHKYILIFYYMADMTKIPD